MSRHHYDDFWQGKRRRDPMVPVSMVLHECDWRLPKFWHGRARHRVIDGFKPRMSHAIRANQARREKAAQGAAAMCVQVVAAVERGGMFDFHATV